MFVSSVGQSFEMKLLPQPVFGYAANKAQRETLIGAAEAVKRLCAHPALTWRDCAEILGPPFSIATLQRHYR